MDEQGIWLDRLNRLTALAHRFHFARILFYPNYHKSSLTFLQTVFLPALIAAAVPLVLHFLSRFRLPVIQFSSLEFLQRLQKRQSRRLQLRQIILLLLRTIAVITIVFVFARPTLQSKGGGGSAAVEMVVLLDDGIASAIQTRDGELGRLCNECALRLFETMDFGDNFTIVPFSQPTIYESAIAGQDVIVKENLASRTPKYIQPKTVLASQIADSILAKTIRPNREIVIVSGFFDSYWDTFTYRPKPNTHIYLLPVGPGRIYNSSIDSVALRSTILRSGQPIELEVWVANNDTKPVEGVLISVYLEGERVAQASIDLPPEGKISKVLMITPNGSGVLAGSVRIDNTDDFLVDNRYYFCLYVPDKINILAVCEDSLTKSVVKAALTSGTTEFIKLDLVDIGHWEAKSLNQYNAILLTGVSRVSEGAVERLGDFVSDGGGLVYFPSMESDVAALSRGLWRRLGFSPATGILTSGGVGWGKFELTHPLFYGMFEPGASPRSPTTKLALKLSVGPGDEVIIPLNDGNPFLVERKSGKGKVLLYAAPLSLQAGDFIFSGIFAPLLFRSVVYSATRQVCDEQNWRTGLSYDIILPLDYAQELTLEGPEGDKWILPPISTPAGIKFEIKEFNQPGIYSLKLGDRVLMKYPVNIPQCKLKSSRADLTDLSKRVSATTMLTDEPQDIQRMLISARYGYELWKTLAAVFIGLLVAESIIARSKKTEES